MKLIVELTENKCRITRHDDKAKKPIEVYNTNDNPDPNIAIQIATHEIINYVMSKGGQVVKKGELPAGRQVKGKPVTVKRSKK
jgi:hypothetical protein